MTQPLYHDNPVSDKPIVPIPLPQGTIFMVGIGFDIDYPTPPEPTWGWFETHNTALNITAVRYGAGATKVGVHKLLGCTAYSSDAYSVNKLYIYIWAISPAGGGA